MARKKTTEKTTMPAAPVAQEADADLKAVRLYLPKDHHKRLRQLAADHETNMAIMARKIVMEYLDKKGGAR